MNIISYAIGLNSGGSKEPVLESISITANGTYTPDAGIDGYNSVSVNVPQDGAPPASAFNLTGDIEYMFASGNWDWYIERYGNQITTTNLTSLKETFKGSKLSTIPFSINAITGSYKICSFSGTFAYCENLTSVPTITGEVSHFYSVFDSCYKLTTIPDSLGELDFTETHGSTGCNIASNFQECRSLRYIPKVLLQNLYSLGRSGSNIPYYYQFKNCYSLDVIDGFAVQPV